MAINRTPFFDKRNGLLLKLPDLLKWDLLLNSEHIIHLALLLNCTIYQLTISTSQEHFTGSLCLFATTRHFLHFWLHNILDPITISNLHFESFIYLHRNEDKSHFAYNYPLEMSHWTLNACPLSVNVLFGVSCEFGHLNMKWLGYLHLKQTISLIALVIVTSTILQNFNYFNFL